MIEKIKSNFVTSQSWDELVHDAYGDRNYSLQQQDGCMPRGIVSLIVPSDEGDDYENDTVPREVNHEEMGVSFKAWLERDPKQPLTAEDDSWSVAMWWNRNFYPSLQMVANDLHAKGLLEAGDYSIVIDW